MVRRYFNVTFTVLIPWNPEYTPWAYMHFKHLFGSLYWGEGLYLKSIFVSLCILKLEILVFCQQNIDAILKKIFFEPIAPSFCFRTFLKISYNIFHLLNIDILEKFRGWISNLGFRGAYIWGNYIRDIICGEFIFGILRFFVLHFLVIQLGIQYSRQVFHEFA